MRTEPAAPGQPLANAILPRLLSFQTTQGLSFHYRRGFQTYVLDEMAAESYADGDEDGGAGKDGFL